MKQLLPQTEQKRILGLYIERAEGRPRELLEALLRAYPNPITEPALKAQLNMTDGFALPSVLRNAQIFIDVIKRIEAGVIYYRLDDQCVQYAALNKLMNGLVTDEFVVRDAPYG